MGDVPTACSSEFLIAVTNTTSTDTKNTDAAYGVTHIDVGAPGTYIYSTLPYNNYGNNTGTSMATPQVAGVIALMYAAMPQSMIQEYKSNPANFALSVKQHLLNGADKISSLNGLVVSGLVNAYEALKKAVCPPVNFTNRTVTTNTTVTSCGDINVENVQVKNGAKLTLDAAGEVNIISDFEVELDSEFEIVIP